MSRPKGWRIQIARGQIFAEGFLLPAKVKVGDKKISKMGQLNVGDEVFFSPTNDCPIRCIVDTIDNNKAIFRKNAILN